jgi:ABC-type uncharacterized transport system substrate-binding protein
MRTLFKALSLSVALATPLGLALAKEPVKIVNVVKHPSLDAAQQLASQAIGKLDDAQKANEYDMDGHAQKAALLLKSANDEIKLAIEAASKSAPPSKTTAQK